LKSFEVQIQLQIHYCVLIQIEKFQVQNRDAEKNEGKDPSKEKKDKEKGDEKSAGEGDKDKKEGAKDKKDAKDAKKS